VNIYGGTITATGNTDAAGIGGGFDGKGGTVNITGGTITATGNGYATGIGGGKYGGGGTVTITGGKVTATAGETASAIGGGSAGVSSAGSLSISGTADVTVKSASGSKYYALFCNPATATPSDGYFVIVHDAENKNFAGTPSSTKVDLVKIGLNDSLYYAHIFFGTDYTVTFDANGGKGTMDTLSAKAGEAVSTINKFKIEEEGKVFLGWNTKADGSGTAYEESESACFASDITLYAQWGEYDCYYTNRKGNAQALAKEKANILTDSIANSGDELASGFWVVEDNITTTKRIYVNKNDVTLILLDGVSLDASKGGVEVKEGGTLTITTGNTTENIEGTGKLIAEGSETGQAGIGGGDYYSNGTVNIYGGTITATGNTDAAGIGGGYDGKGGTVNITGGTITATGNGYATGIGGCKYRGGGTVTITGGKVTATAGETASAIGGGSAGGSSAGSLSISGTADVTVKSASGSKYYALSCDPATATPPEGYSVIVSRRGWKQFCRHTILERG